jgi:hypothetical protein
MNTLTDMLGVAIEAGDRIAYPGRRGSNVYMNVGTVIKADSFYGTLRVKRTNTSENTNGTAGRTVTLSGFERVVVLEKDIGPAPTEYESDSRREIASLGGIWR